VCETAANTLRAGRNVSIRSKQGNRRTKRGGSARTAILKATSDAIARHAQNLEETAGTRIGTHATPPERIASRTFCGTIPARSSITIAAFSACNRAVSATGDPSRRLAQSKERLQAYVDLTTIHVETGETVDAGERKLGLEKADAAPELGYFLRFVHHLVPPSPPTETFIAVTFCGHRTLRWL